MQSFRQNPTAPAFVQDPYPAYEAMRSLGPVLRWEDYDMPVAVGYAATSDILKNRALGREAPPEFAPQIPAHLAPFYAVEAHSMLELEAPRHTRLRGLVLRAFTSRRIAGMGAEIDALCHDLIDRFPAGEFDLLPHYAQKIPVIVIARLLGVPEEMAEDLLAWSNAMVGMYQAGRTRADEDRAVSATEAFVAFMRGYVDTRRAHPGDDLISELIAAEMDGDRLSEDELITTCILLLNAGHEATVHTMGNGVATLIGQHAVDALIADPVNTVEEILRFDPPLHMFTRWVYADVEIAGHRFRRGDQVAALLAAANRDPDRFDAPAMFRPDRAAGQNLSFGAGPHFCVGAPLARLELQIALPILFQRMPGLALAETPRYADVYHFHGLKSLMVRAG